MYTIETREHETKVVTCDRCGKKMWDDDPSGGYSNRTQIRFRAGYASLFGDGNKVEGDLCDKCLYELLGPYLRIVESDALQAWEYGEDPATPISEFFDMQARRLYASYQTPFAMAENVALILREWIDTCFDLKLKRMPVIPPGDAQQADK
ncbi:MAG: hypothetical protein EPN36_16575 [Rhodanobacteraceae bacterium]|nr:MAG: hypothetical protein EPN36_16575 [Rhodanobacteraceae bacterium]